ncbi:MAG: branched-chain amino acid ABC transporter permease [Acidimicrobiia bacterium]
MSTAPTVESPEATETLVEAPPTVARELSPRVRVAGGIGLLLLVLVPVAHSQLTGSPYAYFIGQYAFVYAMLGLSVVILTGYSGLISLMPYSFAGIGAVVTGMAVSSWGWPFWLAIPLAALATLPVSIVVGVASVRLKGLYLAIATLTVSNALGETLFKWERVTGGRSGWTTPKPKLGPIDFSSDFAFYILCLLVVLLLVWMIEGLRTSRLGRAMFAVRDNELEAQALGINAYKTKLTAFVLSSMIAGVGGAFLAALLSNVAPSGFQSPGAEVTSILLVTLVVIGGIDRAWGAFFGAIILVVNQQVAAGAEFFFAFLGAYVAIGLVFFLLYRPGGIVQVAKIQTELIRSRPAYGIATTSAIVLFNALLIFVFLRLS